MSAEYASSFDISSSVDEAEKLIRKWMNKPPVRPVEPKPKIKSILEVILEQCPPRS